MKRTLILTACLLVSAMAAAKPPQSPRLPLDFPHLAEKATDTVNVSLGKDLINLAVKFIPKDDPETGKLVKLLQKLQGIYVRSYEFEKEGEFSTKDFEPVRKIITGSGWKCMVSVRSKRSGEDTDIC